VSNASPSRNSYVLFLTLLALLAFSANSLLCRSALRQSGIDPASFTTLRLVSGAAVLSLLLPGRRGTPQPHGSWVAALALFAYAACFSFAYLELPAGTGALLLFFAVQATMIGAALLSGERLGLRQWCGAGIALTGLLLLFAPGLTAPPLTGALLMAGAGIAWGLYSLLGRRYGNPLLATAGNFLRTLPFALVLSLACLSRARIDLSGGLYAVASGALASAGGYVVWHAALRRLRVTSAAIVQLSVPVLTAWLAVPLLDEPVTLRLIFTALAILGGIALVVLSPRRSIG